MQGMKFIEVAESC